MTKNWLAATSPRKRTWLALIGGLAISAVLLWFALRDVSYQQFVDAFDGAHWGFVPIALALFVFGMYLRAVRWRMLFDPPDKLSMRVSFASINIGALFNNLLPQRAGELTRIVAVNRATGISRLETTATIVAERLIDVFTTGLIGLAFWPLFPKAGWVTVIEIACIVAVVAPVIIIALLARFHMHVPRLAQKLLHRLPRVGHERSHQFADSLGAGAQVLMKPHRLPPVLLVSFASWLVIGLSNWVLLQMFDFSLDVIPAMALVLVSINLAVAIPAAPGSVGVFEAAVQAALVAFGLGSSDALSYAVVAHLLQFFAFFVLGGAGIVTVQRMHRQRTGSPSWEPDEPEPGEAPSGATPERSTVLH